MRATLLAASSALVFVNTALAASYTLLVAHAATRSVASPRCFVYALCRFVALGRSALCRFVALVG